MRCTWSRENRDKLHPPSIGTGKAPQAHTLLGMSSAGGRSARQGWHAQPYGQTGDTSVSRFSCPAAPGWQKEARGGAFRRHVDLTGRPRVVSPATARHSAMSLITLSASCNHQTLTPISVSLSITDSEKLSDVWRWMPASEVLTSLRSIHARGAQPDQALNPRCTRSHVAHARLRSRK